MTKPEFLRELEAQLGLPSGTMHEQCALSDVEGWDSLAAVVFMSVADEKMGVTVSGSAIGNSKTVEDLLSLLGDTLTA